MQHITVNDIQQVIFTTTELIDSLGNRTPAVEIQIECGQSEPTVGVLEGSLVEILPDVADIAIDIILDDIYPETFSTAV